MDFISLKNNGKFFIIPMVIVLFQNLNAHHHNEIHYCVQLSQTNKICRWNSLNIMGPHSFNANEKPCTLTIKANKTWIALIRWHSWIVFIHRKLVTCNDKSLIYFGVEIIWTKSLVANIKGVKMAAPSWYVVLGRVYFLVLPSQKRGPGRHQSISLTTMEQCSSGPYRLLDSTVHTAGLPRISALKVTWSDIWKRICRQARGGEAE